MLQLPFSGALAQFVATPGVNATQLANKLVGPGVTVLNPVLTCGNPPNGGSGAEGIFVNTATSLALDSGIVLTSGSVAGPPGIAAAASAFQSTDFSGPGDAQLNALVGGGTQDACVLEFDFVSTGDTVSFDYVFASEEYPEFACTGYNDVFAFFISGPGIIGSPNIALIPGTTLPVTINNVNDKPCGATGAPYYINNSSSSTIVYDGMTTVLKAYHSVNPCDTYHLKLAVADKGDGAYDSGVFLRAGSLQSNSIQIKPVTLLTIGEDTGVVIRGCLPAQLEFTINKTVDTPFTIPIGVSGTAVPGIDYSPLPSSITIPPGDTTAFLTLTAFVVMPPGGPKTVKIDVYSPYGCADSEIIATATVTLLDSLPVKILTPNDTFCFGASRYIDVMDVTGDTNMNFFWTPTTGVFNPNSKETIIYPPPGVTTYTLNAYYPGYPCDTSQAQITFYTSPLTVDAGPDLDRCANEPAILLGSVTPALAGTTITWSPGATLSDSTIAAPSATTFTTTTYHLNVTDFIGCTYTDSMTLNITGVSSSLDVFADKDIVCPGESVTLGAVLGGLQPCGLATIPNPCAGATTNTQYAGTATLTTKSPSPFFESNASSGDRLQILYTKEELRAQGVTPGYINAMAFNVAVKNSLPTDSFKNYTIRLACTDTATLRPGAFPLYSGMATVFPPTTVATTTGWNNFAFPTPYYWDGSSNLVAEICWNKTPGSGSAATDELYVSGSGYNSVLWLGGAYSGTAPCTADGAAANQVSNLRPNTRFSICSPAEYTYTWSATPAASFSDPTSLTPSSSGLQSTTTFTLTSAPVASPTCTSTGTVTVQVDNSTSVDILLDDPFIQCEAGLVTLNATATGMPFYSNLACGTSGAVSCSSPQAATVGATGGASRIGSPLAGDSRSARTQFIITREELLSSGMQSSTLRGLSLYVAQVAGTDPYANFTIKLGCTPKEQYSSSTDYAGGLTQVYSSSSFVPASGAWNTFSFTTPYNWDSTQNLVVEICSERATPASAADELWVSGTNEYRSIQYRQPTGGGACTAAPNPASSGAYALRPTVRFSYCLPTPQPLPYVWTPGTGLSDSTAQSPSVYVNEGDGPLHYTVSTYDRNGCRASDDITIIIPVHEYTITPEDTTICKGERISIAVSGEGITSWQWYEGAVGNQSGTLSCVDCPAPIAGPQGETTYYVVANDQYNCPETLSTHIALYPEPDIRILTADTLIKFGQSAGLMATGGVAYSWQPAGSLSDPRLPNPVASPVTTTDYVVVGVDEHGCKGMDTVRVAIDYRDSLLVPTAFTPNGDGRNDVFRVANLSFQKLIEFRVFNRWGQEVYSTTDNNGGWDGTWKGVAQDMGIYTYIIRVAFPDGTVSTYKGDVTLIR